MKIYIAGKISGEKIHECTMKFGKAQKDIERQGHEAVNPLSVVNDWHCPWQKAMKLGIKAMMDCDAVYFLPDFRQSPGAKIEYQIVKDLGIKALFNLEDLK